jgi:Domain of unknown function (DUF4352)
MRHVDSGKEAEMRSRAGLLAVMLSVVVVVALSGCSGLTGGGATTSSGSGATSTTVAPSTSSTVAAATTSTTTAKLAWGDAGNWQGISITAAAPQVDQTPESVDPGDQVVYCMVKVVNNSKDAFDYNGLDFVMFDAAHQKYDNFGLTSMPDFGEGTLAPGESVEGAIAFELPATATPSGLEWQPQTATEPLLVWGEL